ILLMCLVLTAQLQAQDCTPSGGPSCPSQGADTNQELTDCIAAGNSIEVKDDITSNCAYDLSGKSFNLKNDVDLRFTGDITVDNTTSFSSNNSSYAIFFGPIEVSTSGDLTIAELNAALATITGTLSLSELLTLLPVEFISFQAKADRNRVHLAWATATESNNSHFEVQHSLNGKDFKKIKEIKGAGTTQVRQDYSYEYRQAVGGLNYYRLKQIDYDGQFEYSEVISVDVQAPKAQYTLFPNPVQNNFVIQTATGEVPTGIRLLNQLGQEIRLDGNTEQVFLPSGIKKGLYVLQFELDGQAFSEKLLIQ
ncbi:MAG: T9SS type A sorting domain-containing protein, partial [Saprospiraceae bacterium]|nr:T9SS type A sorting domain-containing protein [Saprospiraceae bacterium]